MAYVKPRLIVQRDTRANQPAAGDVAVGTLYFVTDEWVIERSNGSTWDAFGAFDGTSVDWDGTRLSVTKDGGAGQILLTSYGSYAVLAGRRANGTLASPTQVLQGNPLAFNLGYGYTSSGSFVYATGIVHRARENFTGSATGSDLVFQTTPVGSTGVANIAAFTPAGNFSFTNSSTDPTTGTKVCMVQDGTAPTGMPTNTAGFYGDDVSGTVEAFAIDEADNAAQLTPHNFTLFRPPAPDPTKPATQYPWSYYAKNPYLGVEIGVDLTRLALAVEALTGQTLVHTRTLPPEARLDWVEEQDRKVRREMASYELWERDQLGDAPPRPVVKSPPDWLAERLPPDTEDRLLPVRNFVAAWERNRGL